MAIQAYLKGLVAVATTVAISLHTALTAGPMSAAKWVTIAIAGLGTIAVVLTPNSPQVDTRGRHELGP